MAKKKHQLWHIATKTGRRKIFETPSSLWKKAVEYFEFTSERYMTKQDFVGKDAEEVERKFSIPFSLIGFANYCGVNSKYLWEFEKRLDLNTEEGRDFSEVITHIRDIIYQQKFDGASAGLFNANIIARDLGLADKKEVEENSTTEIKIKGISQDDLDELIDGGE